MPTGPVLATRQQRAPSYWYEESLSRSDCKTDQGTKTRDVSYFKVDGEVSVGMKKLVPTDLPHARSEIASLGYVDYNRFIGFENNRMLERIQFAHRDADDWYADAPIDSRKGGWRGFVWGCRTDTESMLNVADCSLSTFPGLTRFRLQCAEHQTGKSRRDRVLINVEAYKRHQEKNIRYSTVPRTCPQYCRGAR